MVLSMLADLPVGTVAGPVPRDAHCIACDSMHDVILVYGCQYMHVFGALLCRICFVHVHALAHLYETWRCPACRSRVSDFVVANQAGRVQYSWRDCCRFAGQEGCPFR